MLSLRRRRGARRRARILELRDSTSVDARTGAVRSVQCADVLIEAQALEAIWTPAHLERLARTYWRFLSRVTLGLVRVRYDERERAVVLLGRPLKLLIFQAPEYEMDATRGLVRWRIARGLLVSRRGRDGRGYLQIEVRRRAGAGAEAAVSEAPATAESRTPATAESGARATAESPTAEGGPGENGAAGADGGVPLHVEVEVANFYPSIASRLSLRVYDLTQSRIHVIVTYGFLRSLARLDLAESRVGSMRQDTMR